MFLGQLIKSVNKDHKDIRVNGISFDSRKVNKGDVFFAIKGGRTSGNKYIKEALSKGAAIIITQKKIKNKSFHSIRVKDVRKSLAQACSKFYVNKPKNIIAVTGTNGKSSVVNFFYQILSLNNIPVASIGTLGIHSKNFNKKTNLTSVDPLLLHKSLQILFNKKVNNVIIEASSHGLAQKRLDSLNIKSGVFTNLSHDHLDYHNNMRSYLNSKMYLFRNLLKPRSLIITDEDNKEFKEINRIANKRKIKKNTIGTSSGNIKILDNKYKKNKQIIEISINSKKIILEIPLIGYFQIKNLFMAILASFSSGLNTRKVLTQIHKIKPVPGRLEPIINFKNNSTVILDFAHTPDALDKSLEAIKKQFNKKIILVFGCGGERDKKKRFYMGKIANKYCRKVFVTDDNPRSENPKIIRKAIIKGCRKIATDIGSRKLAIKTAMQELDSNEVLLVAGKGHEEIQDYGLKKVIFSDKKIIKQIAKKINLSLKKNSWTEEISKKIFKKRINYQGVSINSKTVKKNNLFFAIKGKNVDGHNFVSEAIKKGAIRSILNKKTNIVKKNKFIKVNNTLSSLKYLAKATRDSFNGKVIGITGSVGKTTLKNLISFTLKNYGNTHCSPQSYNNEFGVPLSVSNLKNKVDYGIFEIGMNKKGEIDKLSKIVNPEIAVITNIAEAHFENFNTLKNIAEAKSEIIKNISKNGSIVLSRDGKFFNFLSQKAKKEGINVVSFSLKKKADIFISKVIKFKNYYKLKISVKKKIYYLKTTNTNNNFINNILATVSVLSILNLNLNKIKNKFVNFQVPPGRGDVQIIKKFKKRFQFIDESYNANPLSMKSAIQNLNNCKKKHNAKKIAFLGDMLELGKKSKQLHRELSIFINRSNVDKVFVYGKYIRETFSFLHADKKGKVFKNLKEAHNHISKIVRNNDLLMIKGSNATGLNKFSKNIKMRQSNVI